MTFTVSGNNQPNAWPFVPSFALQTFSGSFFCGLAHFQGDVELQGGGADSCTIFYSFEMGGIVGSLFASISKKAIIEGTEKGLENMVKLSEDA